jgi:hypothetical protein
MDKQRLMEVLNDSTCIISKGEPTQRKLPGISLLLWGLMVPMSDARVEALAKVDCQFLTVGVNVEQAEKHRADFMAFLDEYPEPNKLADGPTYKHLASVVGDELTALRIFGLGQVLGVWDVLLPNNLGIPQELVDEAADLGLIVTTGYQSQQQGVTPMTAVG